MTELTFSAGVRATLDLRDSRGDVRLLDGESGTIAVATGSDAAPFVLRDGDHFRIRLTGGGTIALPPELPVEVLVPQAVRLRLSRRGETEVSRQEPAAAGSPEQGAGADGDLGEFVRLMSEQSRRIFGDMTEKVRHSGFDASGDVAKRLDEAAGRIDEQVQRVAERVEREVERAFGFVERATKGDGQEGATHRRHHDVHFRHGQEAERAARAAERAARATERAAERASRTERRAGRGRWWFTDRLDELSRAAAGAASSASATASRPSTSSWSGSGARGEAVGSGSSGGTAGTAGTPPKASPEERRAILDMLAAGAITPDQAARLLDALGG